MKKTIFSFVLMLFLISPVYGETVGLAVGDKAEDFKVVNTEGNEIQLSGLYEDNPVVLIFYRGGWCYYCNLQLQDYQKNIEKFNKLGARVLAISVDTPENAEKTVEEKTLDFDVISNPKADLLKLYNVVFHVPKELSDKYKKEYNIDLEAASGRADGLIAIPATYVINEKGEITYSFVDKDYKKRPKIKDVLKAVEELKAPPSVVF